ncbi:CDK5 and ABL1 enzyme substrate 2, partial [Bos mutus]
DGQAQQGWLGQTRAREWRLLLHPGCPGHAHSSAHGGELPQLVRSGLSGALPAPPGLCPPAPPRRRTPLPCGKPGSLMQQQGSLWQSWKASSQQGSQPPSGCKPLLWSGSGEGGRKAAAPHLAGLVCAQNSRCHCQRCPCLCTRTLARRRVASQRCSLEFLEDTVGCPSGQSDLLFTCRTKHISGSPRHKGLKKTHFIKNMRQYDTRNSRIVLICARRSLCAAFSVLPYGEGLRVSDLRLDSQKQRHPSGGVSVSSEMVFQLEGVELGADGKVVSYAKFLYPTNALVTLKPDSHGPAPQPRPSVPRTLLGSRCKPVPPRAAPAGSELGDALEYNPNLLDDPQWPCGKHKRVLIFASYMTTVIEYVKPSDLKKDMNETFREKFPHIRLTLSKIRSLKREMRNLSEECGLEPVTVSMAYVYFEKLVLQGKLNKQNRKLCAGACVLLAAKISSDLRKSDVKQLIDKLEERFRFNRRDLIGFEFTVLVALELALYLPENQVLPHYRRLTQQF